MVRATVKAAKTAALLCPNDHLIGGKRSGTPSRRSGSGNEERSSPPSLNGRYRLGEATFASASGIDQVAPIVLKKSGVAGAGLC
jgi:hypothetical protein